MEEILDRLKRRRACSPSLMWLIQMPDPETAWDTCPNGTWMCWLLDQLEIVHTFKPKYPEIMGLTAYHNTVDQHYKDKGMQALEEKLEKASPSEKVQLRLKIIRITEEADQLGKNASRKAYLEEAKNLADMIRKQFQEIPPLDTL